MFWKHKTLDQLNDQEWESLCDGCGRCCLNKLEDSETGTIYPTNIACRLLDIENCHCQDYPNRLQQVSDCMSLRHDLDNALKWLPQSCAYRLLAEDKDLPEWHPLITGNKNSVIEAGMSIKYMAISEDEAGDPTEHILDDDAELY